MDCFIQYPTEWLGCFIQYPTEWLGCFIQYPTEWLGWFIQYPTEWLGCFIQYPTEWLGCFIQYPTEWLGCFIQYPTEWLGCFIQYPTEWLGCIAYVAMVNCRMPSSDVAMSVSVTGKMRGELWSKGGSSSHRWRPTRSQIDHMKWQDSGLYRRNVHVHACYLLILFYEKP